MSKIDFNNTQIAFQYKSNKDLKFSAFIYRLVAINWMVKLTPVFIKIADFLGIPYVWAIKKTIFRQFCGGESIDECSRTIEVLANSNVGTILDYSVEGEENEANFDLTKDEIIKTISTSAQNLHIPFSVFKITGLVRVALLEKIGNNDSLSNEEIREWQKAQQRVEEICSNAYNNRVRIFIDAEESWIQFAIDDLADAMMNKFNKVESIVYNTIQLYRHDRLNFLKQNILMHTSAGIKPGYKLVRGAYMEKETNRAEALNYSNPIQPSKKATDADYDAAVNLCVQHYPNVSICAGTHNADSMLKLVELLETNNIPLNAKEIYFSQLLGMSDNLSFNLAANGLNVAKYVPYGPVKSVLPYLIRRAQENTSIAGQMGRELQLLNQEIKRRKI